MEQILAMPLTTLYGRLLAHREAAWDVLRTLPWWAWKRRAMMVGAIAAYDYEILALKSLESQSPVIAGAGSEGVLHH